MSGRYRGRSGFGAYRGTRGGYNGHNEGYYNSNRGRGRGAFYGNSPRGNHYYYPYMRPYPTREESAGSQVMPLANENPYTNSKTKPEHPDPEHYNGYRGTKNEYSSRDGRKMRGSDGYYYDGPSHGEYIGDNGNLYYDEGYYNGPESRPGQEDVLNTNDSPVDQTLDGDAKLSRTNYEYPNYQGNYNSFQAHGPSIQHEERSHGGYYRGGKGEYYEDYYANASGYNNYRDPVENRVESDERIMHNELPYSDIPNDHDKNTVPTGPAKTLSLNKESRSAENFKTNLEKEKLEKEKEKEFREKHWISRLHLEGDIKSQMIKNFEELDKINNNLLDISIKKLELEMEVSKYNRLTRTEEEKCKSLDEKLEAMNLSI